MSILTAKHALIGSISSLILVVAAIAVPVVFVYSGPIAGFLESNLRLSVAPGSTGGVRLAQFSDPLDDDDGPGGYEYPLGPEIEKGELDLTSYAVRAPLARPSEDSAEAYWQFEVSFGKAHPTGLSGGGFRGPAVHIYIDIDGAASGSTQSAFGEGELIRFDPTHPWDYVVSADGWSPVGTIKSANGSYSASAKTDWNAGLRRLTLRIDLSKAPLLLQSVLDGRETWHYVLVGAYDGAREGHFAAVKPEASLHDGGGARDEWAPPRLRSHRLERKRPSRGTFLRGWGQRHPRARQASRRGSLPRSAIVRQRKGRGRGCEGQRTRRIRS